MCALLEVGDGAAFAALADFASRMNP